MARKKRKKSSGGGSSWLVTFSDLMTLLLTFFVLLLSMATMDKTKLIEVFTVFINDIGFIAEKRSGKIETHFHIFDEILKDPLDVFEKQHRIKDLLFPDEVLPEGMSRSTLDKNLRILQRNEGVVFMLTDALLFPSGSSTVSPVGQILLQRLGEFLASNPGSVNIAGYTDTTPARSPDNYQLSALRAYSVLDIFLKMGMPQEKFSLSAYGEHQPLADNATEEGRAKNRREEILIKDMHSIY